MTSHESTYAHSLLSFLLHNRLDSFTLSHTPMRDDPLTACLAGQQTHHPLALHPRAVEERLDPLKEAGIGSFFSKKLTELKFTHHLQFKRWAKDEPQLEGELG
jgi:hypothetical protein